MKTYLPPQLSTDLSPPPSLPPPLSPTILSATQPSSPYPLRLAKYLTQIRLTKINFKSKLLRGRVVANTQTTTCKFANIISDTQQCSESYSCSGSSEETSIKSSGAITIRLRVSGPNSHESPSDRKTQFGGWLLRYGNQKRRGRRRLL